VLIRVSPDLRLNPVPVLCPTKDFRSDDTGAFGPFEMGDFGFGGGVEVGITVLDPAGSPIANADVHAEGKVVGGGTLSANGKSDASGRLTLRLLPSDPGDAVNAGAKYKITVFPTFDSENASAVYSLVVGSQAQTLSVTCPRKVTLFGRVMAPPVGGGDTAPLASVPVLVEGNPAAADPGRSLIKGLTTGVDGIYSAQVEPGSYRVTAMPAGDRPLPWATQLVSATGATQAPDLVLADAREVNGTLVYHKASGQTVSVAGATITVYRTPVSSLVQPIKLFEALTDSNGQFKAVLPRAPADSSY
jgi:hypothetical protein